MTILDALHRAWLKTNDMWAREAELLEKDPDDIITKAREQRFWRELQEIEGFINEEKARQTA